MKCKQSFALFWLVLALFVPLAFPAALFAADSIPAPWQSVDVGAVGIAGSANETNDGDLHRALD